MSWQVLLKAPSISGEQELPDTKLMYVQYLSFSGGADIIRQIIQTNRSNRGIRNIPKWNQQIINTDTGRLGRQFPQISNIKDVQKNANALEPDMTDLTTRDVSYKNIETQLKDLIDAQDFEGIEKWLQIDSGPQASTRAKRKKAVSININALKNLIITSPPDMYIDAYYYDTTDFSFEDLQGGGQPDFDEDVGQALRGWIRIRDGKLFFVNKRGKFSGKIPPYVKLALEETLGKKVKLTPSKLVKLIGADISPGMNIEQADDTEYKSNIENTEDVFNYLNLLVKLGITSNEFMLGNPPSLFYNTILKRKDANTSIIYPALRVILKEPQFNVEEWYMSDKGTRDERAENYLRDKFLREWTVGDVKQQKREEELVASGFIELRNLFKLSPTERKKKLAINKDDIRELYNDYMASVKQTHAEGSMLFSEENYDFLVELEKKIDSGVDAEKLANHFGLQDASGISATLEDILTSVIMESPIKITDIIGEPVTVGKGIFKYTGRRLSATLKTEIKDKIKGDPSKGIKGDPSVDLEDLKKNVDKLYKFLVNHKMTVTASKKKKLIQSLKDMDADSIDVSDFSPSQLILEDIIEMMCQLDWIFRNKSLIQVRNKFSDAISEGKGKANKQIPKFITDFEGAYPKIKESLVKATKDKVNNMIESEKSVAHYDRLVRKNYKTADFFGRLVDVGVLRRA
jgi:hypothetical protein